MYSLCFRFQLPLLRLFLPRLRGQRRLASAFFLLQALVLLLLAFGHLAQWYTSVTFILLAAYSLFLVVRCCSDSIVFPY
ncbi:MAG: hypothetical protein QM743_13315 [Chitinophagaceae bacterium]